MWFEKFSENTPPDSLVDVHKHAERSIHIPNSNQSDFRIDAILSFVMQTLLF